MTQQNKAPYLCPECADTGTPVAVTAAMDITLHLRCPACGHTWDVKHNAEGVSCRVHPPTQRLRA